MPFVCGKRRSVRHAVLLGVVALLGACQFPRDIAAPAPVATSILLNRDTASLVVGSLVQLEATVRDTSGIARSESTRLNSSHQIISYAVFCLKKKKRHY